jgi:hypothetical protein
MPDFLVKGHTYAVNGEVTNVNLHNLVEEATVQNLDRSTMATAFAGITIGSSEPASPKTGECFYDTDVNVLFIYNGSAFVPVGTWEFLFDDPDTLNFGGGDGIISGDGSGGNVTWTTVDVSSDITSGLTAKAVLLQVELLLVNTDATAESVTVEFRKTGTTPTKTRRCVASNSSATTEEGSDRNNTLFIVPLDTSEQFDYQVTFVGTNNTAADTWSITLVGYHI